MAERRSLAEYRQRQNGDGPGSFEHEVKADQTAPQTAAAAPQFEVADEYGVRDVAETLIGEHYPHLRDAHIVYLFEGKDHRQGDRVLPGRTVKLQPLDRFFEGGKGDVAAGADFAVILSRKTWLAHAEPKWREACLDHLLAHTTGELNEDGNWVYGLRKPEISEFSDVIRRRGLWTEQLQEAGAIIRQLRLPEPVGAP